MAKKKIEAKLDETSKTVKPILRNIEWLTPDGKARVVTAGEKREERLAQGYRMIEETDLPIMEKK